jgi:transposase
MNDELDVKRGRRPKVKAVNRDQLILEPTDIERLVAEDHEVRALWELTGGLDLSAFYESIVSEEGEAGREATDPRILICLWVYAYRSGVSAAREVSRLSEYHPAYRWITGARSINYHTLSDFRIRHQEALDELFAEILAVLTAEGLVSLERVMHDGTKIKANAGLDSFHKEQRLLQALAVAQEQVAAMGDPQEAAEVGPREAAARRRSAQEKQQRLNHALEELQALRRTREKSKAPEARVSSSDPEARVMHQSDGGYAPSYNVQLSTDSKAGAVVGVGVSQSGTDHPELPAAADRIEENTGKKPEQLIVDGGFTNRETILEMDRRGIDLIGSLTSGKEALKGSLEARGIDPRFGPDAFTYEPASNVYRCPAGQSLVLQSTAQTRGKTVSRYAASWKICETCPFRMQCCPKRSGRGRSITRATDGPVMAAFKQKMATVQAQAIYKQRGPIAEFTNAWLKDKLTLRQFRLRGKAKVYLETLWACLTCNIQLWIRKVWRPAWA